MKKWQEAAAAFRALDEAQPGQRRLALAKTVADAMGLSEQTVRRAVAADVYTRAQLGFLGLSEDSVKGALGSIEALRRIEEINSAVAADLKKPVLLGKISNPAILKIEHETKRAVHMVVPEEARWRYLLWACLSLGIDYESECVSSGSDQTSLFGAMFHADIESKNRNAFCIFLSPRVVYSRNFGAVDNLVPNVFGATCFYKQVYFVSDAADDIDKINSYIRRSTRRSINLEAHLIRNIVRHYDL